MTRLSACLRRQIGVCLLGHSGICVSRGQRALQQAHLQEGEAALQLQCMLESYKVHLAAEGTLATWEPQVEKPSPYQQLKLVWLSADLLLAGEGDYGLDAPMALAKWLGRDEQSLRQELAEIREYLNRHPNRKRRWS